MFQIILTFGVNCAFFFFFFYFSVGLGVWVKVRVVQKGWIISDQVTKSLWIFVEVLFTFEGFPNEMTFVWCLVVIAVWWNVIISPPPPKVWWRELFPESVSDYVSGHLILRWCTHWKRQTVFDNRGADQGLSLSFYEPVEWIVFLHIPLVLLAILKHWRKFLAEQPIIFSTSLYIFPSPINVLTKVRCSLEKKKEQRFNSYLTATQWPVFLSFSRDKWHANVLASSLNRGHLVHTCLFTEWMTSLLNPTLPFLDGPRFIFLLFL